MEHLTLDNAQHFRPDESFSSPTARIVCSNGIIDSIATQPDSASTVSDTPSTRSFNASGLFVFPGFFDAHLHLKHLGMQHYWYDLNECTSKKDCLQTIHAISDRQQTALLMGLDEQGFSDEKSLPSLTELDAVSDNTPLMLLRHDGHIGMVNSAFAQSYSLSAPGILHERQLFAAKRRAFETDVSLIYEYLLLAQQKCFAAGITTVQEAALDLTTYRCLCDLVAQGKWQLHVEAAIYDESLLRLYKKKHVAQTRFIRLHGRKIFLDGSIGAGTAALNENYLDQPSNGNLFYQPAELEHEIQDCFAHDLQPFLHVIGDRAIDTAIAAIKKVRHSTGRRDLICRLEHAELISQKQLETCAAENIALSIQPNQHRLDFSQFGKRLPAEYLNRLGRFKTMQESDVLWAVGTDSPYGELNPYRTLNDMTSTWQQEPEQTLNIKDALKHYTVYSAALSEQEKLYGSIQENSCANFVLYDTNLLTCKDVASIQPVAVIAHGKVVHENRVLV